MRAITQYFNKLVAAGNGDKIMAFGVGKPDITNHNAIDLFIGEADCESSNRPPQLAPRRRRGWQHGLNQGSSNVEQHA